MASQSLRHHTIPYPQNPDFYGRDDILQAIASAFERQATSISSVALWGAAGIGKTQIALEVAHKHWADGGRAILWIASETSAETTKSFYDAARELQLEGYSKNAPATNRKLVLQWLQNTDIPWLLVLDGVEDQDQLVGSWPTVGRGRILVTYRGQLLAESGPAATLLEVPAFTITQSTELILRILDEDPAMADEVKATNELSAKLGGLPLAVDAIAKQIKTSRQFRSVAEYLPYFEQNESSALKSPRRWTSNFWYLKNLDGLWQSDFDKLDENASRLLGILCFMSPESIPMFLFQDNDRFRWHPSENTAVTDLGIFDAADYLLVCSLVRINTKTGFIAVHRLIQESYFSQMTAESQREAFHGALILLRAHFPRQQGSKHLWVDRDSCDTLHPHVMAFNERYKSMKAPDNFSTEMSQYTELIQDHAWYMVEIQHFRQAEDSLLSLLATTDKNSLPAARIHRSLIGLYERTGRSNKACAAATREFAILRKHLPDRDADMANAHSNIGYTLVSAYKASEAIAHLNTAVAIAKSHPKPVCYQDYNIDRFLRNRGRCKQQLGQLDEALQDFLEAEYYQAKIYGPGDHYDGETKYERAKIAAQQGDLETAAKLGRKAHKLLAAGKPTHASVAAALYHRARIAMLHNNNNKTALKHLQDAVAICRRNEAHGGNPGEAARVQWRMSLVFERMDMAEEAGLLRAEAEEARWELLATGDYAVVGDDGADEEAEWDALVGLLYR
ncbi:P-loop containing nucleoside triphosphate hydrolase protein [Chaetomium fimeti]|uniref:P-loop containing nucleoside triphosphate hydrolase protein n=1 Tax=Chaetomium fimeti TaxID=1854472 RepID=A0AAE0HAD6_9PEZI|nr:P-loop containing nucleoside triphosphate hydrolase protein [Chaetomium fimeti]